MWEGLSDCFMALLGFAKANPFSGGFLLGSIIASIIAYYIAKNIGFKGHTEVVRQWKDLLREAKKENKILKKENQDKDSRIRVFHSELDRLKKELDEKSLKK